MTQSEIFERVVEILERVRIPYMIVGSIASTAYGRPRLTHDMDIVVDLRWNQIDEFVSNFDQSWFVDKEMVKKAVEDKFHFNVIHSPTGNKIDFFLLKDSAYDLEQFARRKMEKFDENRFAFFASVEDVIIRKMDYYLEGGSTKHLEDIKGILSTYGGEIDFSCIAKWTARRGTTEVWEQLRSSL